MYSSSRGQGMERQRRYSERGRRCSLVAVAVYTVVCSVFVLASWAYTGAPRTETVSTAQSSSSPLRFARFVRQNGQVAQNQASSPVHASTRSHDEEVHKKDLASPRILLQIPGHGIVINSSTVEDFRALELDYHSLVPPSVRYTPQETSEQRKIREPIEHAITRALIQPDSDRWGKDFGPMEGMMGCFGANGRLGNTNGCEIHSGDPVRCAKSPGCAYCPASGKCSESDGNHAECDSGYFKRTVPSAPQDVCKGDKVLRLSGGRFVPQGDFSGCTDFSPLRIFMAALSNDQTAMFYHFMKELFSDCFKKLWFGSAIPEPVDIARRAFDNLVIMDKRYDTPFMPWFTILSDYCPRILGEMDDGLCFCEEGSWDLKSGQSNARYFQDLVFDVLGLEYPKKKDKPKLGLLQRTLKRFIVNERTLLDKAKELGFDAELYPLEYMTVYEQMKVLSELDVLAGVHGGGLTNGFFMRPGSQVLQIVPWNVHNATIFFGDIAESAGAKYEEMEVDRKSALLHTDLLKEEGEELNELIAKGGFPREAQMFFYFWINQDLKVNLDAWRQRLVKYYREWGVRERFRDPA